MITLQCKLEFKNKEDKEKVLALMRRFSSAIKYAYKRLLEGKARNELKKDWDRAASRLVSSCFLGQGLWCG